MDIREERVDGARRSMVLGFGGTAALALGGCHHIPQRRIPDAGACSIGSNQFLLTDDVRRAWSAKTSYFDAHAHFFNAQDVPVRDFIGKSLGHNLSPWLQHVVSILAPTVEALSHTLAPSAELELRTLCRRSSDAKTGARQELELVQDVLRHQERVAVELARALNETAFPRLINEKLAALASQRRTLVLGFGPTRFDEDFVLRSIRRGTVYSDVSRGTTPASQDRRISPLAGSPAGIDERDLDESSGLLAFVAALLQPRHYNLNWYMQNYAAGSDRLPLSGCFGAMVDFNYWLRAPRSITHMRDQVLLHEKMSILSGGFMLPVIGYNPWTDIKQQDESLNAVEWAVKEHGCVGVKIYPPMGFFPYDNAKLPLETTEHRPNLVELDKRLDALYRKCSELGIPVMAHANDSLGRDHHHDDIGGPAGWSALQDHLHKNQLELRVNLAHFGGHDDQQAGATSWSRDFAALMSSTGKLQVYADVGHWEALFTSQAARDRLKSLLSKPLRDGRPGETVAGRILFGTDWLMLVKARNWARYGNDFVDVLRQLNVAPADMSQILGGAALDCYGLSDRRPTANRERLRKFFVENTNSPPGWMH